MEGCETVVKMSVGVTKCYDWGIKKKGKAWRGDKG